MVDVLVVFLLFANVIGGYTRGTLRQLWSLGVLAVSAFLSGYIYQVLAGPISQFIHSDPGSKLASFVVAYAVISIVLHGPVDTVVQLEKRYHGPLAAVDDRLAGAILGAIEAIGAVQVAAALLIAFPVLGWDGWVRSSSLIPTFINQLPFMFPLLPPHLHTVLTVIK